MSRLLGAAGLGLALLALAATRSAGASTVEQTSPTPGTGTASPEPTPLPSATPVIVDGRACRSGRLVNGFLAWGRDDPYPDCFVSVKADGPPVVYGLDLPAELYRLRSATVDSPTGMVYVSYSRSSGPNAETPAIELTLRRTYSSPAPTPIRDASDAIEASYFPKPGIEVTRLSGLRSGCWIDVGGLYCIGIDTHFSDLTLQEAAALLMQIPYPTETPRPPTTGTGGGNGRTALPSEAGTVGIGLLAGGTILSLMLAVSWRKRA